MLDEVLVDVDRLDQLVEDLLALARSTRPAGPCAAASRSRSTSWSTEVADDYAGCPRTGALVAPIAVIRRRGSGRRCAGSS